LPDNGGLVHQMGGMCIFCIRIEQRRLQGQRLITFSLALVSHFNYSQIKAETLMGNYRSSSNGHVEMFNCTIMDAVRFFLEKQQDKWDTNVQQIAMVIRSAVNTGFTC